MSLEITFNKVHFENRVRQLLDELLDSGLLSINPYDLDDADFQNLLEERSKGFMESNDILESVAHNFCTIGHIAGHIDLEYVGYPFKRAIISFDNDKNLYINYRTFHCVMNPLICTSGFNQICKNYEVCCSVEGSNMPIEQIFMIDSQEEILCSYYFPVLDNYKKQRTCYRLYNLSHVGNNRVDILRKNCVKSQIFLLNHLLRFTALYTPSAILLVNGCFHGYAVGDDISSKFVEIFDADYRTLFERKYREISSVIEDKKIEMKDLF